MVDDPVPDSVHHKIKRLPRYSYSYSYISPPPSGHRADSPLISFKDLHAQKVSAGLFVAIVWFEPLFFRPRRLRCATFFLNAAQGDGADRGMFKSPSPAGRGPPWVRNRIKDVEIKNEGFVKRDVAQHPVKRLSLQKALGTFQPGLLTLSRVLSRSLSVEGSNSEARRMLKPSIQHLKAPGPTKHCGSVYRFCSMALHTPPRPFRGAESTCLNHQKRHRCTLSAGYGTTERDS
ncbi:hypothetical protein EYF80_049412 [Liparis tanakae]|uniref:Uncharacterized protein n=1 Tax=Liparis tanakae TaxID=230148 RepID=A0A4Z2FHP1_9TELE|nr:hypothetical protein EYF80_049412 [Liparis tanakae]